MIQLGLKEDLMSPRSDIFPGKKKGGRKRGGRDQGREGRKEEGL